MAVTSLQSIPIRRLSWAEYHYRWENYLCIGCDGELASTHKCLRKILVWVEDEDDDEYGDEEPVVDPPLSTKSSLPLPSSIPIDTSKSNTPSLLLPEISENDQFEAVDEQNLFDEMTISENKEHSFEKVEIKEETGNISNFEVVSYVIDSKDELAFGKNFVSALIDEIDVKEIELGNYFVNEECFSVKNLVDAGLVYDRGKNILVFDKMIVRDVRTDDVCYDILIDGFVKKGEGVNQLSKPIQKRVQEEIVNALLLGQRSKASYLLSKLGFRDEALKAWDFIPILQYCARTRDPLFVMETWKFLMEENNKFGMEVKE